MYFSRRTRKLYPFFGEINNKFYSTLKPIFPYSILKKLKVQLFLSITRKKTNIHYTSRNFQEKKKKTGNVRLGYVSLGWVRLV